MLWNRAHMILLLATSVALAACDAGPSSKSAAKRPLQDPKVFLDRAKQGPTEQDMKNLATVERWRRAGWFRSRGSAPPVFNFEEAEERARTAEERARTDPRRFQRSETYRPQPNYQTVPEYGDHYVPDPTYGQ